MTTAWAHLPNAKYIDRIIEDVKINPKKWAAGSAVWEAAWDAAWVARDAAWVARGAIFALIAYDNCAELLNADPEQVKILALLGDQKAILLYPTCVALQKEAA